MQPGEVRRAMYTLMAANWATLVLKAESPMAQSSLEEREIERERLISISPLRPALTAHLSVRQIDSNGFCL